MIWPFIFVFPLQTLVYPILKKTLKIPARVLYGTWILQKFAPHAWSEIYIEGQGWIPVDPSMGRLKLFYHPLLNISTSIYYGVLAKKDKYFGNHEGKRLAFSIDPERPLTPEYQDSNDFDDTVEKNCITGKEIAWGYESVAGKAPFLQPIYPRIHSKEKKTSNSLLFGNWKGKHLHTRKNLSYKLKTTSYTIGFVILFMELVNDYLLRVDLFNMLLPMFSLPLILLGTILSVFRREGNAVVYLFGFIFMFSVLGYIGTYLTSS